MAECHPVGFQWVMEAKARGATIIHVDPRFTRTSAVSDIHAAIRAGTDIAFLGALVNHVLSNDLYFREYVVAYTNASTIITEEYVDSEDLGGLFSGYDEETRTYDSESWRYDDGTRRPRRRSARTRRRMRPASPRRQAPGGPRVDGEPARDDDARAPALRVPDREAALRALHARDGRRTSAASPCSSSRRSPTR